MANTIRYIDSFFYLDDGSIVRQRPQRTYEIATTSEVVVDNIQLVGTTHAAVAAGSATDVCYVEIQNLSSSAVIQYGYDSGGTFVAVGTLNPSDPPARLGRVPTLANLYLDSNTASTPVRVILSKIVSP
jgi:hypothetical protein